MVSPRITITAPAESVTGPGQHHHVNMVVLVYPAADLFQFSGHYLIHHVTSFRSA
jgi:hypothetical protein